MRLVIAALYAALTAGAVTMVYPFVLMLASSVSSGADVNTYSLIPKYLYSAKALFPKYADDRYAGDIDLINSYYGTSFSRIEEVRPPDVDPNSKEAELIARDWDRFVSSLPTKYKQAGFEQYMQAPSRLGEEYRKYCRTRFGNDITKLNAAYIEENATFENVIPPFERFKMREWEPDNSVKMREWLEFKSKLPAFFLRPILVDPLYQVFLRDTVYEGSIDRLNKEWGTSLKSFTQIHLPSSQPTQPGQAKSWERFMREQMPFRYMEVDPRSVAYFRKFLTGRYHGDISSLNKLHESSYRSFDEIVLPKRMPTGGPALMDWMDFIAKGIPVNYMRAASAENLYREHLVKEFGSLDEVNKQFGMSWKSVMDINPPVYLADWQHVDANASSLRSEFFTRNYRVVMNYVLLHGRAVLNTVIFVLAVIITQLIVNPACAYALSRYNLNYSYKVLLFLLATMAFPAEVAMIPNFLLLKQFHLLNTYWALILPGMASGYSIFLLKGFFDSLPKELYEAGMLDGASEVTMFRKITIPMSKPIFAVIALHAFTGAYGAFMYAMLVCQDSKMWTIMVWLYQLQIGAPQYVTMAALTVAAIPTLLVFLFTQNVIMRGIIIPSYK